MSRTPIDVAMFFYTYGSAKLDFSVKLYHVD